ncbi:unnamed protein product [Durusdinium trenchii]|uniref:Apple domain-containing protein n=2 Tax=Durusdinium trenchii TaxID=1381693 RepID=A0ABP0KLK5_9DINO
MEDPECVEALNSDAPISRWESANFLPALQRGAVRTFLILSVLGLLALLCRSPGAGRTALRWAPDAAIAEWSGPMSKDEVLPMKKWAKVFKVQDHMDDPLTLRRYYQYSHHPDFVKEKAKTEELMHWAAEHRCPPMSVGTELVADSDMEVQKTVPTAMDCQRSCTQTPGCVAWTWVQDEGDDFQNCYRRESLQRFWSPEPNHKEGVVSGMPCSREKHEAEQWPQKEMDFFRLPKPPKYPPPRPIGGTRLLCIAVCLPFTKEQDLLIMQYHYGIGIFACDTFAIYSSVSMELAPGVLTRRVTSTLLGELGGSFLTVLNLGAFMQVWKQVLWDGEYLHHDWILKVDPDTVFLVNRLRPILANYNEEMGPSGIYLNNCKDGMHGPLEVFSRSAIMQLANTSEYCAEKLDGGKPCQKDCDKFWDITYRGHCNGPCTKWWGEDIWCDQCLYQFTEAKRIFEPTLLQEEHCDPEPGWRDCQNPKIVAYHPFKKPEDYRVCLERASGLKFDT